MLHHKGAISLFNTLGDDLVLDIASVHVIALEVAVTAGNDRFADKSLGLTTYHPYRKPAEALRRYPDHKSDR